MSISAYTINCFDEVKKNPQFRNKWIKDIAWIEIIKDQCFNIPKGTCIEKGSLNLGFSKQHPYKTHDFLLKQKVTSATPAGVYKARNGTENAYYVTEPNKLPDSLATTGTWRGKWISSLKDLKDNDSEMTKKRMPTTTIVSGRKKQRTTRNSLKQKLGLLVPPDHRRLSSPVNFIRLWGQVEFSFCLCSTNSHAHGELFWAKAHPTVL
jgi:hypothetical protein